MKPLPWGRGGGRDYVSVLEDSLCYKFINSQARVSGRRIGEILI